VSEPGRQRTRRPAPPTSRERWTARAGSPLAAALAIALAILPGCASTTRIDVISIDGPGVMTIEPARAVYATPDRNAAEIYLTTLAPEILASDKPLAEDAGGVIIAINQFFTPLARRTPIADTASNASIRHIVVSGDQIGVYGGGGFVLPGGRPGDNTYRATLDEASLRLLRATPGFADRLGASELQGRIAASRNAPEAERLAALVRRILAREDLSEVEPETVPNALDRGSETSPERGTLQAP